MYGKGITNDIDFIVRALSSIREFMEDEGQGAAYERFIAPASASVRFAKALNRSVTGSMNDMPNMRRIGWRLGTFRPSRSAHGSRKSLCRPLGEGVLATAPPYPTQIRVRWAVEEAEP
jgi:hypothetical protein